jgi:NAD(P)-dependent dehydrogenase (short-subunit alcohol dehydrogenase family)
MVVSTAFRPHLADRRRAIAVLPATAKRTPLGRKLPVPADIARTIATLLSDDMAFVTGETLKVDGGYSLSL